MTVEILTPREVPLGGLRAMTVRRTLPQRERSLIGAWCFLDHYGPDDVAVTGGMSVAPHPHTGLQTVSWLFTGEIEHRDSAGHHALVRPGELNLMTAGHGISHSEVSTAATTTLHGAQLWVALPDAARDGTPGFEHYAPPEVTGDGWAVRVFVGSLLGSTSPPRPRCSALRSCSARVPCWRSTSTRRTSTVSWPTPAWSAWTAPRSRRTSWPTWLPAPGD
jgi:redox-sensitive bicupin YhaK (pirin superfamily)